MPGSLHKTRKQIAKKRNGEVNALHVKSRDSMRLHKATIRDQRIEKLASARGKKEQPIGECPLSSVSVTASSIWVIFGAVLICLGAAVDRVAYFQFGLRERGFTAVELSDVQELIDG